MESHEKRLAATPFVSAVSLFSMSDGQCLMAEFLHLPSDILHQKGPSDEEPVPFWLIEDGGPSYATAVINLTKGEVVWFMTNGEA